jgi:hypothetical protein
MAWLNGRGPPTRRVQRFLGPYGPQSVAPGLGRKDSGGASDAGANAGLEVASDPLRNGNGAAIGLETVEVELEALRPLPEVRIIDVAAALIQRVDHLEEAVLPTGGLGGCVQGRRARVLAGDREVAEDDRRLARADLLPSRGAVRAAQVRIDNQLGPGAPSMVVGTGRRDRGSG